MSSLSPGWFSPRSLVLVAAVLTPAGAVAGPTSATPATAVAPAPSSGSDVAAYRELIQTYREESNRDRAVTEHLSRGGDG